jgi:hypothetical protein
MLDPDVEIEDVAIGFLERVVIRQRLRAGRAASVQAKACQQPKD